MKKYKKNIGILLSGIVIAASTQSIISIQALEPTINQTNIEESTSNNSKNLKGEVAEVTNEQGLIKALEDENIKIIDIKNNIVIDAGSPYKDAKRYDIYISGDRKEIRGNGYKISTVLYDRMPEYTWITSHANTKIDNLKLYGMGITAEKGNTYINNCDIERSTVESFQEGKVSLQNVQTKNTSISTCGKLVINSSKLIDSNIANYGRSNAESEIINTEIMGMGYGESLISSEIGTMTLENIKIINPGDHAISIENNGYSYNGLKNKVIVKGILEVDGAKKEAIVLKKKYDGNKNVPAQLYVEGNIKQKGNKYTIKAEEEGIYTKVHNNNSIEKSTEKWSHTYYNTKNRDGNKPEAIVHETKLVGTHDYQTAIEVSREGWKRSNTVVVVNSKSLPDALSAAPFAKDMRAPILLTDTNKLQSETKKEISRLGAKLVYIVGGESVVSKSVKNELESMGIKVNVISGRDRYETSLKVAKEFMNSPTEIAVVNGRTGLPDSVSIAPVAGENGMPILLSSPSEGIKIFNQYIKDNNIKKSYVIGGESSVSQEVASKLPNPERLGGKDRNETNSIILEKFYTEQRLNNIYIAKNGMKASSDLIDALVVGALAPNEESPVVIVGNKLDPRQESILSKKQPTEITQVGRNGNENAFNQLVQMYRK